MDDVVDCKPDRHGQRADHRLDGRIEVRRADHAGERIADRDVDADHLMQCIVDALEMGRSTGDLNPTDAKRFRLGLVELERVDELPCERGETLTDGIGCLRPRYLVEGLVLPARSREGQMTENRGRFDRADVERRCDRVLERASTPVEHTGELARPAACDEQGGRFVADRDDDGRGVVRRRSTDAGFDECTEQAERLEIECLEPDPGEIRNARIRLDLVPRRYDEQDTAHLLPVLA